MNEYAQNVPLAAPDSSGGILADIQKMLSGWAANIQAMVGSVSRSGANKEAMISLDHVAIAEQPVTQDKRDGFLSYLHRAYGSRNPNDQEAFLQFVQGQKQLCDAFVQVFDPKSAFTAALSESHYQALRRLQDTPSRPLLMPDAQLKQSSLVSIQSIVINRRDDMVSYKKLLDDPAFLRQLSQHLSQPVPPKTISAEKKDVLIESLVQTRGLLGREPAVHIYANAKGQIIEHQALAECFDVNGEPAHVMATELQKYMPSAAPEMIAALTREYMEDRKQAAILVVDGLQLDGEIVNEAIRRSEEIRLGKFTHKISGEKAAAQSARNTP